MAKPVVIDAQGLTRVKLGAGVTVAVGDLIGFDGTNWVKADADSRVEPKFLCMEAGKGGEEVTCCKSGVIYDSDAPYTAGTEQYCGTGAGAHSAAPALSTTMTILQRFGVPLATDRMSFDLTPRGPAVLRGQVAIDPPSIAAGAASDVSVTFTGAAVGDVVQAVPPSDLEAGLVPILARVSAANTIVVRLYNPTAGAVDGASKTWTFYLHRH